MDKLHKWIVGRDVAWAKHVGIRGLLNLEFTPIHLLVKEFIQGIIWFHTDVIELVVTRGSDTAHRKHGGRDVIIATSRALKLLAIVPSKALVDREGWKVSMLKGMYIVRMLVLI
jgi:hypothetical protein